MSGFDKSADENKSINVNIDADGDLSGLDFDNLQLDINSENVELIDPDTIFDPDTGDSSIVEQFDELYAKYKNRFGQTFDPYLITRESDDTIQNAIEVLNRALVSGKPVRPKDLQIPDYNDDAPENEIGAQIVI